MAGKVQWKWNDAGNTATRAIDGHALKIKENQGRWDGIFDGKVVAHAKGSEYLKYRLAQIAKGVITPRSLAKAS